MTYTNPDDVHCAAVIIKKFLRELPEPIMTFKLYDIIVASTCKYQKWLGQAMLEFYSMIKIILPLNFSKQVFLIVQSLCSEMIKH